MPQPEYPWRRPYAPDPDPNSPPTAADGTARGPDFAEPPKPVVAQTKPKRTKLWVLLAVALVIVIVAGVIGGWLVYRRYTAEPPATPDAAVWVEVTGLT